MDRIAQPAVDQQDEAVFDQAVVELGRLLAAGEPRAAEAVLARYPALAAGRNQVLELIYTEYVLRDDCGELVPLEAWIARFPELTGDLRQLFHVHEHLSDHGGGPAPGARVRPQRFPEGLVGKYELLELIGQGGSGEVHRARHVALGRTVALKLLRDDGQGTSSQQRFRQEAESAAALQHPGIVQVFEVGLHSGRPFLAMEHVAGGNLAQAIRRHPLTPRAAAETVERLARAIHFAHQHGIVHRDLKPANILLAPSAQPDAIRLGGADGADEIRVEPKVADFGLARQLDSQSLHTLPGAILGTPAYMAPEQASGDPGRAGPASDIYSLGAILYDIIAGRPPFNAATVLETLQLVQHAEPVSLRSLQPDVPRDLATICQKCLHKDPARRYATAEALADDLRRLLDNKPVLARPSTWWERGGKWARRHPAAAALLFLAATGTVVVGGLWLRAEHHRRMAERQTADAIQAREEVWIEHQRLERAAYAHDIALAGRELESSFSTRAAQLLAATPAALRQWEYDHLLARSQNGVIDFGDSSEPLRSVAFSPDRRCLATCSAIWGTNHEADVTIRDLESGAIRARLTGHPGAVLDIQFSPDGKQVATCGAIWQQASQAGGRILLWDAATGELLRELAPDHAASIAFSPDGTRLAAGLFSGEIRVFDLPGGKQPVVLPGPKSLVLDLAMDPSGQRLVAGYRDGSCRVWDLATGQAETVAENAGNIHAVAYAPGGSEFAFASYGGEVRVMRRSGQTWKEKSRHLHSGRLSRMSYSPDGQSLAIALQGGGARLVDPATGQTLRELPGHNGDALAVAFSGDGQLVATAGSDGHARVHDLAWPANPMDVNRGGAFLVGLAPIPGRTWLAIAQGRNTRRNDGSTDRAVKLWDLSTRDWVRSLEGHSAWQTCVAVDGHGQLVASGGEDGTLCVWSPETGELKLKLQAHAGSVRDVAFGENGEQLFSCGSDGSIRIWRLHDGNRVTTWSYDGESPFRLAPITGLGLLAVACEEGRVHLCDPASGKDVHDWRSDNPLTSLAVSRDGDLLAAGDQRGAMVLLSVNRLVAGDPPVAAILDGHTAPVTGLSFAPDGQRLASAATDNCVKLWDVGSGQEVLRLARDELNPDPVVAFDDAGENLVVVSASRLTVWSAPPADDHRRFADEEAVLKWRQRELERSRAARNWLATVHHLDKLLVASPAHTGYRAQRGTCRAILGDFEGGAADFRAAFAESGRIRDLCQHGMLSLRAGNITAYQAAAREAVELVAREDTPSASLNGAAWLCALSAKSGADWPALIRRFEARAENADADFLNTLAALYFRNGQFEESIAITRRGLELRGPDTPAPFDWLFFALALQAAGQPEQADPWVRKFVDWRNAVPETESEARESGVAWNQRRELEMLRLELEETGSAQPETSGTGK